MKTFNNYYRQIYLLFILFFTNNLFAQPIYDLVEPYSLNACQIDANCSQGNSLSNQKGGLFLLYENDNGKQQSQFTGAYFLVNQADGNSYNNDYLVLSASHTAGKTSYDTWLRRNYISSSCGGANPTQIDAIGMRNNVVDSLELIKPPDLEFKKLQYMGTYYYPLLGWSLLPQSNQVTKSLGFPGGHALKVTEYNGIAPVTDDTVEVWKVDLHYGMLQESQSGSPLFNSENYVIGVIRRKSDENCYNPGRKQSSGYGYATRLSYYYHQFSDLLDPEHTGAVQVPTLLPNGTEIGEYKYPSLSKSTNIICYNNVGYVSINNFCEFMEGNVRWDVSNPSLVTIDTSNLQTIEIRPKYSSSSGQITVTAKIYFGENWYKTYGTTLQIGKINYNQISISGDNPLCPYEIGSYFATVPSSVIDYDWQVYNGLQIYYEDGPNLAAMAPYSCNGSPWIIELRVDNGCDWSTPSKTFYVSCDPYCYGGYSYTIYPNPVTSEETIVEAIPDETTKLTDTTFTVDFIVEIYDSNKTKIGESKSSENKASLAVGKIKKGLYFIHITDKTGTTRKPLIIEK